MGKLRFGLYQSYYMMKAVTCEFEYFPLLLIKCGKRLTSVGFQPTYAITPCIVPRVLFQLGR